MFKLLVLSTLLGVTMAAMCPGTTLTDAVRTSILTSHNTFRSTLAQGQSTIKGGQKAAAAKNMYEMVS